ncbi:MAG: T9SS type B sorting domain-containing protein [Bacteroidetes bacterium]|jgi:gliding motility-associated-like protein|nr:T9SS type B sorting domain-containing protein [Bacteroidota bacterium]
MIQRCLILFVSLLAISQLSAQNLSVRLASGADNIIVEGCPDTLILDLSFRPLDDTLRFTVASDASNVDSFFTTMPEEIIFLPGEKTKRFVFEIPEDDLNTDPGTFTFFYSDPELAVVVFQISFDLHSSIPLEINPLSNPPFCINDEVVLQASGAASYFWYLKGINDSEVELGFRKTLRYDPVSRNDTVFVRGSIGNCSADTFYIPEFYNEEYSINPEDTLFICLGSSEQVNFFTSEGDLTWEASDTTISIERQQQRIEVEATQSGFIFFEFEGDNCGTLFDTLVVRVDSLPEEYTFENFPPPNEECGKYCRGDTFSISVNTTPPTLFPEAEFTWEPMDGSIIFGENEQNILVEAQDSNYYVRTVTNNACESEDSIFIEVINPSMELSLSDTTVCVNKPVQVELLNAENYTDISWSPEQGLSCTECPNPTIVTASTRTYTVEGKEEGCCPTSASITVIVDIPNIPIPDVITCPGQPVDIIVDDTGLADPNWTNNTDGLSCTSCFDNTATANGPRMFILEAFDDEGCLNRGVADVDIYSLLDFIDIIADPGTEIGVGGTVGIQVNTEPPLPDGQGQFSYNLNGMDLELSGDSVQVNIIEEGSQELIVTVIDSNGCANTSSIILEGVPPEIDIPNAFTPNGDELNDVFLPVITNAENIEGLIQEFRIYSRWGAEVYVEFGPDVQGWDGNYQGELAPPEVYLYYIKLQLPNGDEEIRKGDVTLVR